MAQIDDADAVSRFQISFINFIDALISVHKHTSVYSVCGSFKHTKKLWKKNSIYDKIR